MNTLALYPSVLCICIEEQAYILLLATEINGRSTSGFIRHLVAPHFCRVRQSFVLQREKYKFRIAFTFMPCLILHTHLQLITSWRQGIQGFGYYRTIGHHLSVPYTSAQLTILLQGIYFSFHFGTDRYPFQIGYANSQLFRLFLDQDFIIQSWHPYPQWRTTQRQVKCSLLRFSGYVCHIRYHLVSIEPTTFIFFNRKEMNRYLETTFGIGHNLSCHPIGFYSLHPPESILQTNYPITDFRTLNWCTGKGTGHSRHENRITCLIGIPHRIERHIKGRALVFFYPERHISPLCFYMTNTHLAYLRQFEYPMESTELIGLYFLLSHLLIVGILQDNGIVHTFLGLHLIP